MTVLRRHAWLLFALCLLLGSAVAAPPKESDFTPADIDQGKALTTLNQMASTNTDAITPRKMRRQAGKCNKGNIRVRREW
jgi:hypothetical protein